MLWLRKCLHQQRLNQLRQYVECGPRLIHTAHGVGQLLGLEPLAFLAVGLPFPLDMSPYTWRGRDLDLADRERVDNLFRLGVGGLSASDLPLATFSRKSPSFQRGTPSANAAEVTDDQPSSPEGDEVDRVLRAIIQRRGQPTFRERLLAAYKGRCAVSGSVEFTVSARFMDGTRPNIRIDTIEKLCARFALELRPTAANRRAGPTGR